MEEIIENLIFLAKNPYVKCIIGIIILVIAYRFFFPTLTTKETPNLNPVLFYQYWDYSTRPDYNEENLYNFAKGEILKKQDGKKILEIFNSLNKNQNISITQNKNNGNVYFFTNSRNYKSEITVYKKENEKLVLDKKFWILHPYKVGYCEYDEENQRIYLAVLGIRFDEGGFLRDGVKGYSVINAGFWIVLNKLF